MKKRFRVRRRIDEPMVRLHWDRDYKYFGTRIEAEEYIHDQVDAALAKDDQTDRYQISELDEREWK